MKELLTKDNVSRETLEIINIIIDEAKKAYKEGNVPVGCAILKNKKIVAKTHNRKNTENISVYHAEILAIIEACKKLETWYLDECELYVTLKPCEMCMAAIGESRIKKVCYLLDSDYYENLKKNTGNVKITKIDKETEYDRILSNFFKTIRKK